MLVAGILEAACRRTSSESNVVEFLLTVPGLDANQAISSWTALHSAACYGNLGALKALLSHPGIDVNKKTSCGLTPLHTLFLSSQSSGRVKDGRIVSLLAFRALIEHPSVDINSTMSYSGTTALHLACRSGRADLVEALMIQHPGRLNVNALAMLSPRHCFVASCCHSHWDVVRALLGCPLLDPASVGRGYSQAKAHRHDSVAMLIEAHWLGLKPLPVTKSECWHMLKKAFR